MSDESGGDFGGGSVSWQITFPENSLTAPINQHPKNPHRKQFRGVDDRPGLTNFYLVLTNKKDGQTIEDENGKKLKDKLEEAVEALDDNPETVTIVLPIKTKSQIRVLWEEPHD